MKCGGLRIWVLLYISKVCFCFQPKISKIGWDVPIIITKVNKRWVTFLRHSVVSYRISWSRAQTKFNKKLLNILRHCCLFLISMIFDVQNVYVFWPTVKWSLWPNVSSIVNCLSSFVTHVLSLNRTS